jgi:hypothetical protein
MISDEVHNKELRNDISQLEIAALLLFSWHGYIFYESDACMRATRGQLCHAGCHFGKVLKREYRESMRA